MRSALLARPLQWGLSLILGGCVSVSTESTLKNLNQETQAFSGYSVNLYRDSTQRQQARAQVQEMLSRPLDQTNAVKVMLLNSPAFQAMLAKGVANAATAAQAGRVPNPTLSLERMSSATEIELSRVLSLGLLDLLTLPKRLSGAEYAVDASRLQLAQALVQAVSAVRQAWVEAVSAQASLGYARQVMDSAQASAELAARMQRTGNISVLARSTQQLYAADAVVNLAAAQHVVKRTQEQLIRRLGLSADQRARLTLPEHLPKLPLQPMSPDQINAQLTTTRLDVRMAAQQLKALGHAQDLAQLTSFTDVEWGIRDARTTERDGGAVSAKYGHEISLKLPLFDWGDLKRQQLDAQTLAAVHAYEAAVLTAGSQVREAYSAYRTSWDVAMHYQREILPMRQRMSDENLYRYNGMFIGTLELLADARSQINGVHSALKAQTQFWLSEAVLNHSLVSTSGAVPDMSGINPSGTDTAGGH